MRPQDYGDWTEVVWIGDNQLVGWLEGHPSNATIKQKLKLPDFETYKYGIKRLHYGAYMYEKRVE